MNNLSKVEEFKKEIQKLKEFNTKYKTDFKLSDTRISFYSLNKGNELFEILNNFTFPKLENLDLRGNQVKDVNLLSKTHLEQLQILNLSENDLDNIEPLSKCDIKNLKELYIFKNK